MNPEKDITHPYLYHIIRKITKYKKIFFYLYTYYALVANVCIYSSQIYTIPNRKNTR